MASIEELLKGNPYKDIFAPIIGAYNKTQLNLPNPHEVWLAATLIETRAQYWGTNMPEGEPSQLVDGGSGGGAGANHCCRKNPKTCSCKGAAAQGARADGSGAASPNTTRTQTLEQELRTIDMSQPNAWQDWSEAVATFYDNIGPFLSYFDYFYKDGAYAEFYRNAVRGFEHPDGNTKGLLISLEQDGADPIPVTPTINVGVLTTSESAFVEAPHVVIYSSSNEKRIYWIDETNYIQPVVSTILGGNNLYYPVSGLGLDTEANAAILSGVINASTGTSGLTSTVSGSVVETQLVVPATVPATVYDLTGYGPVIQGWSGADAPIVPGVPPIFEINTTYSDISLADRFFIMYDFRGDSYMFYYNLDGAGTFVPPVVTTVTTAINIFTGDTSKEILAATQSVLAALALGTAKVTGDLITFEYDDAFATQDIDPGTSIIGVNFTYNDKLIASDATELIDGIDSRERYAELWNELRVPYEATLGNTYPYLDPSVVGVGDPIFRNGSPCGACFRATGIPVWSPGQGDGSPAGDGEVPKGCKGCSSGATSSAFRATAYKTYLIDNYNTPGQIFIATEGRQANIIDLSDIT